MNIRNIVDIALHELRVNIRNRWTLIFAGVFALLILGISYLGMATEGFGGMQNFVRTSASMLNLVLFVVPLLALVMGTLSFTGDKGSAELLYAQPLSRTEVLLGKMTGVFWSIALSTVTGFALAGFLVVAQAGTIGLLRYVLFVVLSLALAQVFLSVSVLVSVASKRKSKAFGISLFLWFFFVLFYDLLVIGGTSFVKGTTADTTLFLSLFGNPVGMVRIAALITLDNAEIFGASGAALLRFFGGQLLSLVVLKFALGLWIVVPLFLSHRLLRVQDI